MQEGVEEGVHEYPPLICVHNVHVYVRMPPEAISDIVNLLGAGSMHAARSPTCTCS
jgi:hypothetical protein